MQNCRIEQNEYKYDKEYSSDIYKDVKHREIKKFRNFCARAKRGDDKFFELFNRRNLSEKVTICTETMINVNVFHLKNIENNIG